MSDIIEYLFLTRSFYEISKKSRRHYKVFEKNVWLLVHRFLIPHIPSTRYLHTRIKKRCASHRIVGK